MQAGGPSKYVEREVEEEYDAPPSHDAAQAKETNVMAIEEMLAKYTRPCPSLEEAFTLVEETQKRVEAGEIKMLGSQESHRRLAELVKRQQSILSQFTPE